MHTLEERRATGRGQPELPRPRGPISTYVLDMLQRPSAATSSGWLDDVDLTDSLVGDDFHLALYVLYELHYHSFGTVEDGVEWNPHVLAVRGELEQRFESA